MTRMRIPHTLDRTRSTWWGLPAYRIFCIVACSLLCLHPPTALGQGDDTAEYRVKLAFLYNFAQFVQWPTDAFTGPDAPLTICIVGPDPFQGELADALRGRKAGDHPTQLKKFKPNDDPRTCQIIFIRASEKAVVRKLLATLKGSNTLAVGESDGFTALGGLINLTLNENKLRFEVNLGAAMQTRLKFSSKLLALAKIVNVEQTP